MRGDRKSDTTSASGVEGPTAMEMIQYPESQFTSLRLQLMLMRLEIQNAGANHSGTFPQDMANIFSQPSALDNRVIEAQEALGYSGAATLAVLGEELRKQKGNHNAQTSPGNSEA
jgi:hypothetical protein